MRKKISIIVPIYNTEKYLSQCLDSLVSQTIDNIEVVLTVDEASKDKSLDIAKSYQTQYPEMVRLIVHPNCLPGDSRNYGLEVATGEYIGFVDSDDLIADTMFETLYTAAECNGADIACCDIEYLYNDGTTKIRSIKTKGNVSVRENPELLSESTCYVWNKIIRKDLIDKYEFRFPKGRWYEDSSVIYNIMLVANKITLVSRPLYQYKVRREGATAHVIDNRIFDVLLAAQDIVDFFKKNNAFDESMCVYVYRICAIHINVRFDTLCGNKDIKTINCFINRVFDFYDSNFPNWIQYTENIDPKIDPLKYAKQDKAFALKFYNKYKFYSSYKLHTGFNDNNNYISFLSKRINPESILYESYEGAGMNCNPYAIFLTLMENKRFDKYIHIWSVRDEKLAKQLRIQWEKYTNVIFVVRNKKEYWKALATSKYLVNNNTFPPYFVKRSEQVYITSWHAVTVKTLGFDYLIGKYDSWNQVRNYLATDYFLAANDFMAENLAKAYKMNCIFEGKIIKEGYPRNDFFCRANITELQEKLIESGIQLEANKKIVLYAPTWKGKHPSAPDIDMTSLDKDIHKLSKTVDLNKYQILIKPHHVVYRNLTEKEKRLGKFIPPHIETNELLAITDILISDYSSIFIDFMYTKRPVLFYMPDINDYEDYRGIYFNLNELPGPTTAHISEIGNWINSIDDIIFQYKKKYDDFYQRMFGEINQKFISQRIVDCIFGDEQKYNVIDLKEDKIKILIYPGDLRKVKVNNYIKEILNGIDYKIFDVSLIVDSDKSLNEKKAILELNENVRVLCKHITPPKTVHENKALKFYLNRNKTKFLSLQKKRLRQMFSREFRRRFGNATFNATLNLDPKNRYYRNLLCAASDAVHMIWSESTLTAKERNVILKKVLLRKLTYQQYLIIDPTHKVLNLDSVKCLAVEKFIDPTKEYVHINNDSHDDCFKYVSVTNCNVRGGLNDNTIYAFRELCMQYSNLVLKIVSKGSVLDRIRDLCKELEIEAFVQIIETDNIEIQYEHLKNSNCIIEVPNNATYMSLRTVRLGQILNKPIIMLDVDNIAQTEIKNGVYKTNGSIMQIYDFMKSVREFSLPLEFSISKHNELINNSILDVIKNPIKVNNGIYHRVKRRVKKMIRKIKRRFKSLYQ